MQWNLDDPSTHGPTSPNSEERIVSYLDMLADDIVLFSSLYMRKLALCHLRGEIPTADDRKLV